MEFWNLNINNHKEQLPALQRLGKDFLGRFGNAFRVYDFLEKTQDLEPYTKDELYVLFVRGNRLLKRLTTSKAPVVQSLLIELNNTIRFIEQRLKNN